MANLSQGWRVAVVGATGSVGEAIVELLQERQFPISEISLLASEQSAGKQVRVSGQTIIVQNIDDFAWQDIDLAFFAAGRSLSSQYAETLADQGTVVIDLSGYFSLQPDIPLVVPTVNPAVLADYRNRNIIAIANSVTCQLLSALQPVTQQNSINRLQLVNLVPASHFGKQGVDELAGQSARLLNGLPIDDGVVFRQQLAFNLLPFATDEHESVLLEREVVAQVHKVLQDYSLPFTVSCIQVPVFYGNGQIVHFESMQPMTVEEFKGSLQGIIDHNISYSEEIATPVTDASNSTQLTISGVRYDCGVPDMIQFWSVADNIRFSAALMAVKCAETLVNDYF